MIQILPYPIEEIPDKDHVFYRIHIENIRDNTIIPGAFRQRDDGMSVDWDKYGSPERLKNVAIEPEKNGIVKFSVKKIRENNLLSVDHDPLPDNRAHSLVKGIPNSGTLKESTRLYLKRNYEWVIKIKEEHK